MNEHMVRSALGSTSGEAGSPNGLIEGVSSVFCSYPKLRTTPSPPQCAHWDTSPKGRGKGTIRHGGISNSIFS